MVPVLVFLLEPAVEKHHLFPTRPGIMEALLASLLSQQPASSTPVLPFVQGCGENMGGSSSSASSLAFDAGQSYQRAISEWMNASKSMHLAQQVQHQQASGWVNGTCKAADANDAEKKLPAPGSEYVQEKLDPRLEKAWQDDKEHVQHYQAVQREQQAPTTEKKEAPVATQYPKAKAMPIRLEQVGTLEVPAGTLELFARIIPKKKDGQSMDDVKTTSVGTSDAAPDPKVPAPPRDPPPHLRSICTPPPPVPVWVGDDDMKRLALHEYVFFTGDGNVCNLVHKGILETLTSRLIRIS